MTNIMQIHKPGVGTYTYEQWKILASNENPNIEQRAEAQKIVKEAEKLAANIPVMKEIKRHA